MNALSPKMVLAALEELIEDLDTARSIVFVSAAALDAGETDLELQSAAALKKAYEKMDEVYDRLSALRPRLTDAEDAS